MTQILNTWASTMDKKVFYTLGAPVYTNGDFSAYAHFNGSFIYTYKNVALNNLVALNQEHVDRLANNQRPVGPYGPEHFLFDRAMQNLTLGMSLL